MSSRRALRIGAVVVAGLAVAWADVGLLGLFVAEREDARGRVELELRVMEQAARSALLDELRARHGRVEQEIGAIFEDPLRDDLGAVEVYAGRQEVPRVAPGYPHGAPARESGERAFYLQLKNREAVLGSNDDVERQIAAVRAVQDARADDELTSAVRTFLALRANTRVHVMWDLPAALVVAEELAGRPRVDPALLHALLREGRTVGTSRIVPIQAQLIELARDLPPDDARFFYERILDVSRAAGAQTSSLEARWTALGPPLDLPADIDGERLFPGLVWIARARPAERAVSGVRADVATVVQVVVDELRARQVLRDDDSFRISVPPGGVPPAHLRVDVTSPRLDALRETADTRFRTKSAFLGVLTAMAAAIGAGVLLDARRRRRYDELRSNFVAAVSHELRTPLASMRLQVEAMLPRAGDDKARERLERLATDVEGLDFLVENILSFSRMERGRLVPRKERVSLTEVAAEAVERARHEAPGITVEVHAPEDVEVLADPELVGLVVHNLVRNAWQHHPRAERRVVVRVENGAGQARVSVEDDGAGVPEVDRERIFGEFERGSRAMSRGTGLGLALCRQIARAHGGEVSLASTGPGGSTFVLALPLPR